MNYCRNYLSMFQTWRAALTRRNDDVVAVMVLGRALLSGVQDGSLEPQAVNVTTVAQFHTHQNS